MISTFQTKKLGCERPDSCTEIGPHALEAGLELTLLELSHPSASSLAMLSRVVILLPQPPACATATSLEASSRALNQ